MKKTKKTSPSTKSDRFRRYFMGLTGRRRVPIRIPTAKEGASDIREWWVVQAKSAKDARAICLLWPMATQSPETGARIVAHNRIRD